MTARKLISLAGYEGFKKQLQRDELLTLRYHGGDGSTIIHAIANEQDFEQTVYHELPAASLVGFYAVPNWGKPSRIYHRPGSDDEYESVRRPVEQFVLNCLSFGLSAAALV